MPRPARILLVGTLIATTACAGVATSQTPSTGVENDQVQLGDVLSNGTLNVVDVDDAVVAVASATGNGLSGAVEHGTLALTSRQQLGGSVRASTDLSARQIGGATTVATTAAGNTADAGAYGADLRADVAQTAGGGPITARTTLDTPAGRYLGGAGVSTTALANSQAFGLRDGRADYVVGQVSGARTEATTRATLQYVPAPSAFTTTAVSNSVSAAGRGAASQDATVRQSAGPAGAQALTLVAAGNAWNLNGASTATANTTTVTNAGGSLDALVDQSNAGAVLAQTAVSAYDFGRGSALAYGVGNSSMVGNDDVLTVIDTAQLNSGGVEATAEFTGHSGYDGYATAVAMGNATTGYSCAECASALQATNRQINDADVSAGASVTVGSSSRNVTATSTAVGNSASFYVTTPGA